MTVGFDSKSRPQKWYDMLNLDKNWPLCVTLDFGPFLPRRRRRDGVLERVSSDSSLSSSSCCCCCCCCCCLLLFLDFESSWSSS